MPVGQTDEQHKKALRIMKNKLLWASIAELAARIQAKAVFLRDGAGPMKWVKDTTVA